MKKKPYLGLFVAAAGFPFIPAVVSSYLSSKYEDEH